ncbi:WAS/WASL-interacting protein family member 1-like isoform X2 [Penaeus indicus]|uniref:WAS/WASL-interacting protein family member 1-like isoform X2 n=1 Tax=Penaeus indicus TaxID=29960 RepID=UPI00300D6893
MACGEGGSLHCVPSAYLPCFALGVVEEGRGRASASKVSKIAGMFQGGGGGGGGGGNGGGGGGGGGSVRGVAGDDDAAPGGSQEASGPQHATVVRTESHLARFNTARALFEKMGQSEGGIAQPPRAAPSSAALSARVPPPAGFGGKVGAGLAKAQDKGESEAKRAGVTVGRVGAATHQFGRRSGSEERPGGLGSRVGRGESLSPARSLGGASTSSSRSGSPSPARTNGHAHHSDQDSGGGGPGGGTGAGGELVGGLAGLRRPGSSSSRSLSTSSTESEPTPRRWPPHAASSSGRPAAPHPADASGTSSSCAAAPSRPETFKSDLTAELRRAPRPEKPEKPAKPESLDRRASTHEQHQELIARHKNWFQSFSKSRSSPTASPSKPDCRPTSPSKAAEWEPRPPSPSKADGRGPQPSKTDLRSPRGAETNEEAAAAEKKEEEGRGGGGGGGGGGKGLVSEQDAWSSVLQSRYGTKAKDILSPRARSEGEATADWRKERAAILSGE